MKTLRASIAAGLFAAAGATGAAAQDGFVVQSANGDSRLVFGLTAQVDGRFSPDDPPPITDTFTIRKIRPTFSGTVAKYFDFRVMPDFGNGAAVLQDAYLDVRLSSKLRLRTGKDKTPVGYEWLQGDPYLLFPERSLASGLLPLRDVGFQAIGDLSPRLSYAAGVFNGVPDSGTSTSDVDVNGAKDLAGRITLQPFKASRAGTGAIAGLGFQVGGSTGTETGALPAFKTSVGQPFFSYASGASADGNRHRFSPAAFYYYKSFGGFAEYTRTTQAIAGPSSRADMTNDAWDVTASYVLTGEAASDRGVRPKAGFDPAAGEWGALQVIARYSQLRIDPGVFSTALAAPGATGKASAFAVGANWYPATVIKYYVMYERTSFAGGDVARPTEHSIVFRTQVAF